MPDKFSKAFITALKNHDTKTLLTIPKSDVHNHLGRGCRVEWLSEKMNHTFANRLLFLTDYRVCRTGT